MLFENEGVFLALSHGYLVNKIKRIIIIAVIKNMLKVLWLSLYCIIGSKCAKSKVQFYCVLLNKMHIRILNEMMMWIAIKKMIMRSLYSQSLNKAYCIVEHCIIRCKTRQRSTKEHAEVLQVIWMNEAIWLTWLDLQGHPHFYTQNSFAQWNAVKTTSFLIVPYNH